jgi:hypothetical protein
VHESARCPNFVGSALRGRDYGMVDTSFGPSDTLFKVQLINSKHKLLKSEIVMNNSQKLNIKYE